MKSIIYDAHTHHVTPQGIISISPGQVMQPGLLYSAGIHPWHTATATPGLWQQLQHMAAMPQTVAIGETGIDALRGGPAHLQEELFRRHISLSEDSGKPLVIHCVRSHQRILELHRSLRPSQPWIIHGFRQKPSVASLLLDEGLYLSLGERFNTDTARIIPPDRLLVETDESTMSIQEIARAVGQARSESEINILETAGSNLARIIRPFPAQNAK